MADITYTLRDNRPEDIPGFEQYSSAEKKLIDRYLINSLFDPQKHLSELHIFSISDELLESNSNYTSYKFLGNAQSAGREGASELVIDPIADSITYGYPNGGVKLLYHFLNDLFTEDKSIAEFFINAISDDRTELRLIASVLEDGAVQQVTTTLNAQLTGQSYFEGFRLNFGNNDLLIGTNINSIPYNNQLAVTVKLYEPLPTTYDVGSILTIVEVVSDSISYEIDAETILEAVKPPTLRAPNFNIEIQDHAVVPSQYLNYNELFSYPVNNSNSQIYSAFNEKGVELSINYNSYEDFVHFSSAQERLLNFKYKVDLVSSYSASLSSISSATQTLAGVSGSRTYYNNLISGVVSNFDHYERFLYYESGSKSWPKTNNSKPYTNAQSIIPGTTSTPNPAVTTWFSNQLNLAAYYDSTNNNLLVNSIPAYLRDDPDNENYLTFIHMVGQHFDNLWLYGKAVSDKYNADNRLDFGISRDLVAEALKNFGVQLYTSNKTTQDLFTTIIGQGYVSGSEQITNYLTGSYTGSNASIQPASYDTYQKEVYKRIYHNLPLLLSSKGTERGLRALINCFGIPQDILQVKLYGGRNTNERPFYGDYTYYTSSLDKIRLDHTGSIVTGSTLSSYTSILKRDDKYTDDLHPIEVGFSPTDNVDSYIISASRTTPSLVSSSIDDYLGDPRNLTSDAYYTYTDTGAPLINLTNLTDQIMSGSTAAYNVQDYVKLIKFFDNTIFKMIKDYIPARAVADTGIIIKPHILGRSKAKSVILSGSTPLYTGSIDTAFISAGGVNNFRDTYGNLPGYEADTRYIRDIQTSIGIVQKTPYLDDHNHNQVNYNGEISGSGITVSTRDLNSANPYKLTTYGENPYSVSFVSSSKVVCLLNTKATAPTLITDPSVGYSPDAFFTYINANCVYSASSDGGANWVKPVTSPITFPIPGTVFTAGVIQSVKLRALNRNIPGTSCQKDIDFQYSPCQLQQTTLGSSISSVTKNTNQPGIDIGAWFTAPVSEILEYTASWTDTSGYNEVNLPFGTNPTNRSVGNFKFDQPVDTVVTIKVRDRALKSLCQIEKPITIAECNLKRKAYSSATSLAVNLRETGQGFTFDYSYYRSLDNGGLWNFENTNSANPPYSSVTTDNNTQLIVTSRYGSALVGASRSYLGGGTRYQDPTYGNDGTHYLHRYYGIQSYFRNVISNTAGFSGANIDTNPLLRYNIFIMTNRNGPTGPNGVVGTTEINTEGYRVTPVALGLDPRDQLYLYDPPAYFVDLDNVFSVSDETNKFASLSYRHMPSNLYGMPSNPYLLYQAGATLPTNAFKPIALTIQSTNNVTTVGTSEASTVFTDVPKQQLYRAYIIQCYRVDNPACLAQVTIYGDHQKLGAEAEGVSGGYPQFRTKSILANWNYNTATNGVVLPAPSPAIPNPVEGVIYGPWITTKVRTYTTAQGTFGVSPNTPPD
jgi:hypothetical protein